MHTGENNVVHRSTSTSSRCDGCGTSTSSATAGRVGTSHRNKAVAHAAPKSCTITNPGTSANRIPANVSLAARATVTAGLANEVEAVNQYAAVMYAPTANGTAALRRRDPLQITASSPNVATLSLRIWDAPERA